MEPAAQIRRHLSRVCRNGGDLRGQMGTAADSPLGKATVYADRYEPALLYAVERAPRRAVLGLGVGVPLPFEGGDAWTAWEAQWLGLRSKVLVTKRGSTPSCVRTRTKLPNPSVNADAPAHGRNLASPFGGASVALYR
jgi:Nitrile reductase, 7-cyano-7-deazaguanine-reductase N-term